MSQEEPPAAREQDRRKSLAGAIRTLHPQVKGQKQRRNPQTQTHLVPRSLYSPQAHTRGDLELGTSLRLAEAARRRLEEAQAASPSLSSSQHYQPLSSCLTKLVKCVFESPYLWEDLWGMRGSKSLSRPQWPPSPRLCTSALSSQRLEALQYLDNSSYQASPPREACRVI